MSQVISLAGQKYIVKGAVRQFYVQRQTQPFRLQGIQSRDDDSSVGRYVNTSFPLGIGWGRINRKSGRGVGGMLDATTDTSHIPATLGRLQETQTHADPAEHFKKAINFKGDLWGLFEEDYDAGENTASFVRKFGATSDDWTGGGTCNTTFANADGSRSFDLVAHKGSMFIVENANNGASSTFEVVYRIVSSTDGATWGDAGGTGFPDSDATNRYLTTTITRRNNFDDDMGRLLSHGNTLVAALYQHPSATDGTSLIGVYSSIDSGANWVTDVTIPSGDGPKALVSWYDLAAVRRPVLVTAEGIYSINIADNLFELIYALDGDPNNGRWAEVGNDGALYVGLGNGSILRLAITDTNRLEVMRIGPPGDGLVSARQGHVNYMLVTPSKWLMVAYGGHAANKNASIFKIDTSVIHTDPETGEAFMAWHHVWQDATGNLDIVAMAYSTEDDATPRLHFAVEGTAASINYHIEEPLVHPLQATIKYQTSSILRLPVDDLGDPHQAAMLLTALLYADDLSAATTGEYIQHHYGKDGAADTTVDNGDFLSGDPDLPFFKTGSITAFADAGTGLVTVTSAAHGLVEGDSVTISGTTSYNGTFTISNVATNTFAILDTWVANDATGTWVVYKGVSAKTIGQRLTFNRDAADNTQTPKLYDFEIQAQNVYLDKRAWECIIDVEEMVKDSSSVKPNVTAGTNIAQTIRANIEAIATSGVLVPFEFNDADGVIYVRVPNDSGPQFSFKIEDSDVQRRGYVLGDIRLVVEEGV